MGGVAEPVAVGLGDKIGEGEEIGFAEGDGDDDGLGDGEGVGVAEVEGLGFTEGLVEGFDAAFADGFGEPKEGEGEGLGLGSGVELGEGEAVSPKTSGLDGKKTDLNQNPEPIRITRRTADRERVSRDGFC